MHHERDVSQEIMSATLKELFEKRENEQLVKVGPTGKFPDGKLTSNDEGEIAFAVGTLKGKVVVNFGVPIASLGMDPKQARRLADSLFKHAASIDGPREKRRKHAR